MADDILSWRVEQACLNAWPALRHSLLDDWVLRFADGLSRRSNSANALRAEIGDFDRIVDACETLYAAHGLPAIFRVTSLIDPAAERRLDALGYAPEGQTLTLHSPLDALAGVRDPDVEVSTAPAPAWLLVMGWMQGHSVEAARTYRGIVGAIALPVAFASIRIDGQLRALAYGAVHDGLLCFESVATDPAYRGRGLARRVTAALVAWGRSRGATGACLQVMEHNEAGRALYRRLGFGEALYRYHYRRQPRVA